MTRTLVPPLRRTTLSRAGGLGLLALAALGAAAGCKNPTYRIEDRDTRVNVVVLAPGAERGEMTVPLLVYVGDRKAIDQPVRFGPGATRYDAPTVYMHSGKPEVSVVVGGRAVATQTIKAEGPSWVLVTLNGGGATISNPDKDPTAAR